MSLLNPPEVFLSNNAYEVTTIGIVVHPHCVLVKTGITIVAARLGTLLRYYKWGKETSVHR